MDNIGFKNSSNTLTMSQIIQLKADDPKNISFANNYVAQENQYTLNGQIMIVTKDVQSAFELGRVYQQHLHNTK